MTRYTLALRMEEHVDACNISNANITYDPVIVSATPSLNRDWINSEELKLDCALNIKLTEGNGVLISDAQIVQN